LQEDVFRVNRAHFATGPLQKRWLSTDSLLQFERMFVFCFSSQFAVFGIVFWSTISGTIFYNTGQRKVQGFEKQQAKIMISFQ
jgi:hypothetical protein